MNRNTRLAQHVAIQKETKIFRQMAANYKQIAYFDERGWRIVIDARDAGQLFIFKFAFITDFGPAKGETIRRANFFISKAAFEYCLSIWSRNGYTYFAT